MGKILLKDITLNDRQVDILIEGNRISSVREASAGHAEPGPDVEIIDGHHKTVLPGFINMHTHAGMSVMRGIGEDMVFQDWINKIWEVEKNIDGEFVYQATRLACLEMIKTGTTTFNDQYWYDLDAWRAVSELGLRCALSYVILDQRHPEESERQKEECLQYYEAARQWGDRTQFVMSIHAIYSVSEEMVLWATAFAREHGLKLHIHVSETRQEVEDCKLAHGGMTPIEYLDSLGVLADNVIAAHTLWLSPHDIEILGQRGVTCVHNINSNLKLTSGYQFKYNELKAAGANVCLGTDGCASSNNLDMLEAMKTAAMVQKAWRQDPVAMPLNELMDIATINGAKALGIDAGRVEEGALADLILVDTDNYNFISAGSFLANFIYSAHSDCINSVICDGRFLMRNRVVPGEEAILEGARKVVSNIK